MKLLIQDNKTYFALLALFFVMGGIFTLATDKVDATLFFNDYRMDFVNSFFRWVTKMGEEPLYFLIGIVCLFVRLRYAIMVGLTGLTVMGVSHGLKSVFQEDRPLAYFRSLNLESQLHLVPGVDVHTGATSFPSGHSMSAFALYSLLILLLPGRKRYVLPLFLLAIAVALSRVYLVQHFWQDVYVGGLIGALLAMGIYALHSRVSRQPHPVLDRPLWRLGA